jgi:hypothetical protein
VAAPELAGAPEAAALLGAALDPPLVEQAERRKTAAAAMAPSRPAAGMRVGNVTDRFLWDFGRCGARADTARLYTVAMPS